MPRSAPIRRSVIGALAAFALPVSVTGAAWAQADRMAVVASFTILADLAREVGGERVAVTALIGPNADAHGFEPSPADAGRLAAARVVLVNGLGFEGWIDRLVKASGTKGAVVVASRGVKVRREEGHDHGPGLDPHAFQDVANAKLYVVAIRDALAAADPAGRAVYETNAAAYLVTLDGLDREVREGIARIPPPRRRLITSHDAFAYFAAAYRIRFLALRGVSTADDISARDVARIVRQIKAEKIPAVFLENVSDPRLMEQIARESGARVGGRLYSDALSEPGGPAATYVAMVRANLQALVAALGD